MDDFTTAMIDLAQSRRRLALALLDGYAAGALGEPASPEKIAELEAEIAACDAELARLEGSGAPTP